MNIYLQRCLLPCAAEWWQIIEISAVNLGKSGLDFEAFQEKLRMLLSVCRSQVPGTGILGTVFVCLLACLMLVDAATLFMLFPSLHAGEREHGRIISNAFRTFLSVVPLPWVVQVDIWWLPWKFGGLGGTQIFRLGKFVGFVLQSQIIQLQAFAVQRISVSKLLSHAIKGGRHIFWCFVNFLGKVSIVEYLRNDGGPPVMISIILSTIR